MTFCIHMFWFKLGVCSGGIENNVGPQKIYTIFTAPTTMTTFRVCFFFWPVLVYLPIWFFSATSARCVHCLLLGQQTQIADCVAMFWQQLIGIKIYNTGIINGLLICHKISYLAAERRVQLRLCLCTRTMLPDGINQNAYHALPIQIPDTKTPNSPAFKDIFPNRHRDSLWLPRNCITCATLTPRHTFPKHLLISWVRQRSTGSAIICHIVVSSSRSMKRKTQTEGNRNGDALFHIIFKASSYFRIQSFRFLLHTLLQYD